jgi:membrane-associated phospholipid phosphatase
MRRLWGLACLLSCSLSIPARAQTSISRPPPTPEHPVEWHDDWPTFSWSEGALTLAAGVSTGFLALQTPPESPRWRGGVLFDDAVRDTARLKSAQARHVARRVGDMPYYAAGLLPLLVDPVVALWAHGEPKTALNLELMGLEAFSYAGLLSFVSTRISIRERPDATECRRHQPAGNCPVDNEAFWSGHTSIVAASAGLVCAHHQYLPLWGGGAGDVAACALAATGAVVTGVSRIMADRHYTTDVLAGSAIGVLAGYGVPTLLHYTRHRQVRVTVAPSELGDGASLHLLGSF